MAKGKGLALCRILHQVVDILPGSWNSQRARAGKNLGEIAMTQFRPFEMDSIPIEEQFMNWKEIVKPPYDKNASGS